MPRSIKRNDLLTRLKKKGFNVEQGSGHITIVFAPKGKVTDCSRISRCPDKRHGTWVQQWTERGNVRNAFLLLFPFQVPFPRMIIIYIYYSSSSSMRTEKSYYVIFR